VQTLPVHPSLVRHRTASTLAMSRTSSFSAQRVGNGGCRLRLQLVKQVRTRYAMPADSEHPDHAQDVEYCTQAWLTEDEYAAAEVGPRSCVL
jgi:hypothetical protein